MYLPFALSFLLNIAGLDFIPFDDLTLVFNPGETRVCALFQVVQDGLVEGTESVQLTVASTTIGIGSPNMIILSILDSDGELAFSSLYYGGNMNKKRESHSLYLHNLAQARSGKSARPSYIAVFVNSINL